MELAPLASQKELKTGSLTAEIARLKENPLPAKAQTVGPLRTAGSVLKCGNYLKTTPQGIFHREVALSDQFFDDIPMIILSSKH